MPCAGNSETHCCWLDGKVCKYLEEDTVEGRHWACGLRRKLGDWDKVITSKEYRKDVAPVLEPLGINCKDWPVGHRCGDCGYGC